MNPSLQPVQIAFYAVLGALGCLIIGYNYRFSLIGKAGTHVSPAPIIGGALAVYGTSKLIDSRWVLLFLVLDYTIPAMILGTVFATLQELNYKRKSIWIYKSSHSENHFLETGHCVISLVHEQSLGITTLDGRKHLASPIHPELGIPLPDGLEFIPEDFKDMVIVYGEKTSEAAKTKETVLISLRGIRKQGD
jgi:hypothetical protein